MAAFGSAYAHTVSPWQSSVAIVPAAATTSASDTDNYDADSNWTRTPIQLFPTPIHVLQLDLDDPSMSTLVTHDLVDLFYHWRSTDPSGRQLSNAGGGWQSQADLLATFGRMGGVPTENLDVAVKLHSVLRAAIYSAIVDESSTLASSLWKLLGRGDKPMDVDIDDVIIQDAWANINGPNQYNTKHSHGHLLAAVLYVSNTTGCTEDPDGGWLEFFDPRGQIELKSNRWLGQYGGFRVKPSDGMLVVFPGCVAFLFIYLLIHC